MIDIHIAALEVLHPCISGQIVHERREAFLALPQRLLSLLAVLDIGTRSVPLDNISLLIAQRHGTDQKPAIFPVSAAQTHFILGRFPGCHVRSPHFHDPRNIFGMNWASWFFYKLFQRKSAIVRPTLIEEINHAVRPNTPGHGGNCIDDKPEMFLLLGRYCLNLPGILERYLLRLLAIGDVLGNASDPTNLAGRISHGKSAVADPSQRPVRSHDAVFHIKSLFAPPFKDTDHALAILAMYRVRE